MQNVSCIGEFDCLAKQVAKVEQIAFVQECNQEGRHSCSGYSSRLGTGPGM